MFNEYSDFTPVKSENSVVPQQPGGKQFVLKVRKDRLDYQIHMIFKDPHEVIEKQKIYNVIKAHREASGNNCSIEKPRRTWFTVTKVEKTNDSSQFPDYKKLLHDYDTSRKELIPQLNYIGS